MLPQQLLEHLAFGLHLECNPLLFYLSKNLCWRNGAGNLDWACFGCLCGKGTWRKSDGSDFVTEWGNCSEGAPPPLKKILQAWKHQDKGKVYPLTGLQWLGKQIILVACWLNGIGHKHVRNWGQWSAKTLFPWVILCAGLSSALQPYVLTISCSGNVHLTFQKKKKTICLHS